MLKNLLMFINGNNKSMYDLTTLPKTIPVMEVVIWKNEFLKKRESKSKVSKIRVGKNGEIYIGKNIYHIIGDEFEILQLKQRHVPADDLFSLAEYYHNTTGSKMDLSRVTVRLENGATL